MKSLAGWFLAGMVVLGLAGCAQPSGGSDKDDDTDNGGSSIGYKTSIDIPQSLMTGSSDEQVLMSRAMADSEQIESFAYVNVTQAIDQLVSIAAMNAQYGVMLLEAIDQNNLTPSSATISGKSVTITQAIVDSMTAAMPEGAEDELDVSEMVGQEMPIPDFVYNSSSDSDFDFMVTMTMSEEEGGGSQTFYWTTNFTRTALQFEFMGSTGVMAYDAATDSALMSFEGTDFSFEVKAVVDSSNEANHGIYLSQTFSFGGSDSGTMTAYADDLGGLVANDFVGSQYSAKYTEGFNSNGEVTYQKFEVDQSEFPDFEGHETGELDATYAEKLDELPDSFGDAETFFD